jgi:diaminohydroxyphosphoribosylaminopyrimidine deaminase/5-amino-6-(5-phosphoribosylamino)uracil reductase
LIKGTTLHKNKHYISKTKVIKQLMRTQTETDNIYMQRCLDLARQAEGKTYPNPMVGSVIVHQGRIIGEGYHRKAGGPHAEVWAINSVTNPELLKEATLYVNLEPCAHYGQTPPCSLLIEQKRIPRVVIGCMDTFSEVAGRGIQRLKAAGAEVTIGVLEQESRELNRRFFTFHETKRPYIILKWANTRDGFLDIDREVAKDNRPTWITNEYARRMVHLWRSREQAILVGSTTALKDNPSLTVRDWSGPHPLRLVLDRGNQLPDHLALFDGESPTLLFCSEKKADNKQAEKIVIPANQEPVSAILEELYKRQIQSLIVEGGARLLKAFIDKGLWDEARVFVGNQWFKEGIRSPELHQAPLQSEKFGNSELFVYRNI